MTVRPERLQALLAPYLEPCGATLEADLREDSLDNTALQRLSHFLELLLKWNARTNLTAIRQPEQIVCRHFGESLFLACQVRLLVAPDATVLDLGSGAGFPGLPLQILCPDLAITLAESQGKKAAFLREAVRTLGLSTQVWANRAELLPAAQTYDLVTMRAVDRWCAALRTAEYRVSSGGVLALLVGERTGEKRCIEYLVPGSSKRYLRLCRK